jgi:hypothetical protein
MRRFVEWWRTTKPLWLDFAEIWTDDRRDFILLWSRDIAVGFFVAGFFTIVISTWATKTTAESSPAEGEPDAIMMLIQHTNEAQLALHEQHLEHHDEQISELRADVAILKTRMEGEQTFQYRMYGAIGSVMVGIAGLFAKVRMGGTRR